MHSNESSMIKSCWVCCWGKKVDICISLYTYTYIYIYITCTESVIWTTQWEEVPVYPYGFPIQWVAAQLRKLFWLRHLSSRACFIPLRITWIQDETEHHWKVAVFSCKSCEQKTLWDLICGFLALTWVCSLVARTLRTAWWNLRVWKSWAPEHGMIWSVAKQ